MNSQPFLFVRDPTETRDLDFGDCKIVYTECTDADLNEVMRDPVFRDPSTGLRDNYAIDTAMLKRHVVGWEFNGANGQALEFTPTNLDFMLERLTIAGRRRLVGAISGLIREGQESGKGSENGSSG